MMHRTLPVIGALILLSASFGSGQDGARSSVSGPLRAREVHGARHCRSDRADLRSRSRAPRYGAARPSGPGQRRALRARRRYPRGSVVRRSVQGLQLDGVPRQGWIRRVLHGHDRLRALDASAGDERSVQPVERAAVTFHPAVDCRAVCAVASDGNYDDGFRLERHRSRCRPPARAAQRRTGCRSSPGRRAGRAPEGTRPAIQTRWRVLLCWRLPTTVQARSMHRIRFRQATLR